MTDIFLSYKAEDRARVKPLVDAFIAEGHSVWWDLHIEGGASWRATIQQNLDTAACVIVVWSVHSVGPDSHFVQDEASRARRRGVYLPVAIDPVEAPLGFGQEHALRLVGWRGDRKDPFFQDVLAAVRAIIAGGPRAAPTARAKRLDRRPNRARNVLAVAAAGLAVVAALIWFKAPAKLCAATGAPCPALFSPAAAQDNSVAVLPFANLSGDPKQDYFSDGLSEELINTLARIKPLHVAARSSSFKFRGSHESGVAIGKALGVTYILDGSVRREGGMVRISAQLSDAKTGFERWSQTYDRDAKDIFAVQSGIAQAVAEALKIQLLGEDVASLNRDGTLSPEAFDSYLRGRNLLEQGAGEATYHEAIKLLDAAIAADPRYAAAHSERAIALIYLATYYPPTNLRATYDDALASARRATDLAPDLAQTQRTRAAALIFANRDFTNAKKALDRARVNGGGDAAVLRDHGMLTCELGDCQGGVADLQHAAKLDPLNPQSHRLLGLVLISARHYPEAIAALHQALALSPNMENVHAQLAYALMLQGQLTEAKVELTTEPLKWARMTGQAILLQRLGDTSGAKLALAALIADGGDENAYQEAQVFAQWGDAERAFAALDTAIRLNDSGLLALKVDPLFDPLHRDPRFAVRLSRLGLQEKA
jgi:TolB-like protein/Tfp pilus assembly protein PilF